MEQGSLAFVPCSLADKSLQTCSSYFSWNWCLTLETVAASDATAHDRQSRQTVTPLVRPRIEMPTVAIIAAVRLRPVGIEWSFIGWRSPELVAGV